MAKYDISRLILLTHSQYYVFYSSKLMLSQKRSQSQLPLIITLLIDFGFGVSQNLQTHNFV